MEIDFIYKIRIFVEINKINIMLYLRINENTKQAKLFAEYIKTLPFVEIIDIENSDRVTKEQLKEDIKKSFKKVKTKKTKPLKHLLNGK